MRLLVSAIEPSSNLHLKHLLKHLGSVELVGAFDESLGTPMCSARDFSVMGLFDVVGKIFAAKKAIKALALEALSCDKVLLIDAPAFNLPLAKAIKELDPKKEIIYYILPKVWAWKKKRVKAVEQYCDKRIAIFPFENQFYNEPLYFGNPLVDEINACKEKIQKTDTIAFLAGSRKREVKALLPLYKEVRQHFSQKAVLVIPAHFDDAYIKELYGDISMFEISRDTHEALLQSDFAYVCSGTATLEASLIGVPSVLVYKTNPIEFFIGRRLVKLPFVGLANIIFDFAQKQPLHPELLQADVTVEKMLEEYKKHDEKEFLKRSKELRQMLEKGSLERIAKMLLQN